jgi:hypothetical protein
MTEPLNPAEQPTAEEIARHYSAALDSVNLINAGRPEGMSESDWADTLARNQEHLKIMIAKPWWTDQDLGPLIQAAG